MRPIVLYVWGTEATVKSDENKFAIFERKILRRIFGLKKSILGEFGIRKIEIEEL